MKKMYTKSELKRALDLIEEGYSFSEVSREMGMNKSILAREMRKQKNEKANKNIERDNKRIKQENLEIYNKCTR